MSARSTAGPLQRPATVRVGPLAQIPKVLRDLGCEPAEVLGQCGFALAYFDDPDLPLPYAAASRLIEHCVEASGCEHFGLLVGKHGGASSLGLPGFLLMNAADVGSALRDLLQYLELHDSGGVVWLETHNDRSLLGYTVVEPESNASDQICDLAMAVACNLLRALCGSDWHPGEVLLPRRRPADSSPWTGVFKAPVRFDAGRAAVSFPSRWLSHPVPAADPMLHRHLEREAEHAREAVAAGFAHHVRRAVAGAIASARCTAADVAWLLGMHERTMNRRLLMEGTTFRRVHDEVRYAMSRQLLAHTSMNLTDIASALGYAEASAFVRAFSRWSGSTPARWRSAGRGSAGTKTAD